MGRKPLERAAIAKVTVGVFMLIGGHLPAFELGENFVNTYRRVESFIKRHPRPFIAKVSRPTGGVHSGRPGEVRMWKSKTDLP